MKSASSARSRRDFLRSTIAATAAAVSGGSIAGAALPALLGSHGILPALGHTDCDVDTAWSALRSALECAPRGGRRVDLRCHE